METPKEKPFRVAGSVLDVLGLQFLSDSQVAKKSSQSEIKVHSGDIYLKVIGI